MEDGSQFLRIIILIFFCLAAYFAVAETAFASVSRVRLKAASERGDKRARRALTILDQFDHAVTTILIGTNITHLGIASIVTVLVIRRWGNSLVSLSTIVTTIAVFFLGEMLPKSVAKRYSEPLALATATSLLFFMKLFHPIARILTIIGQAAARRVGQEDEVTVTEEELQDIIDDMADAGMLNEEQTELINSALNLDDIRLDRILTALSDMDMISADMTPAEVAAFLTEHRHSRYPVYDGTADHIIGTLQLRVYLNAYRKDPAPDLRALLDPPVFVPCHISVPEFINEMNLKKVSLAIVLGENGTTCGLTTVADALEELIGDLWDEDDMRGGDVA